MSGGSRRILVLEDDPNILKMLSERLEMRGFHMAVAMNSTTALMQVKKQLPDLIILEAALPTLNGYEFCAKLKSQKQYRSIPIVIWTSKGQDKDYWQARACGADAYLTKPSKDEDLLFLVNRLVEALSPKRPSPSTHKRAT